MNIVIEGQHLDTGDAFRDHAETTIQEISDKHSPRAIGSAVTVARDGNGFRAAIMFHAMAGVEARAAGEGHDAYSAFDKAAERIAKQLRRRKRRVLGTRRDDSGAVADTSFGWG